MALLLVHTHYSLLTAPCSPREWCEEAVRLGHEHLVITDLNGLYGYLAFAREARRVGLKPVFGVELVGSGRPVPGQTAPGQTGDERRLVAIAEDRTGYASLCRLVTARHLSERFDFAMDAAENQAGVSFLCADPALLLELAGRVAKERLFVALPANGERAARRAQSGSRQSGSRQSGSKAVRKAPDPGSIVEREKLLTAAAVLDLPSIAVWDCWYARPEDLDAQRLFLAVKWNRSFTQEDGVVAAALPSFVQAQAGHAEFPDAVAAARALVERCSLDFEDSAEPVFPDYATAAGEDAASTLRHLAEAGLRLRYSEPKAVVRQRLQRELEVITAMGFAPYFLVVREIAELARARGILLVGRGSAADSLVSYCLRLTDADPIRYGLVFERFLNAARMGDRPDIDLDFCWRRRDEVLEAVYEHFGHERVAMIATYNTCGPRSAYGEAAKVMGLGTDEVRRRGRLLPHHRHGDLDFVAAVAEAPGFYRGAVDREREERILRAAAKLYGAPRHLGVHPGGIVLTPGPIADYAPLERAAKGLVVTQYDMHFVEDLGLVKIDLLGNRALTILADGERQVKALALGDAVLDLEAIPEDDAKTGAMLSAGRTLGCFQAESPAVRTLLRQLQADNMDTMIQVIALIRPGPAASGMKDRFIRRARGLEAVAVAHPVLAEVFADTYGIMLYQEDVILAAMAVGGYSAEAGDVLRRHLGKVTDGDEETREAFVVAGLRRGLMREAIDQVWGEMARFAGYSFCKAHAVTYGRIGYRCVYMKAHYPAPYLAAMLSNDAGYYEKGVYVGEARRLGIELLGPCVYRSEREYVAERVDGIRIGLMDVRRLSEHTLTAIAAARRLGGPFLDLDDFLERVEPAQDEAQNLILCGALDALGATRPELLWRLQIAGTRKVTVGTPELIAGALAPAPVRYPELPEYGAARRAELELEILGFCVDGHPMDVLFGAAPGLRGVIPLAAAADFVGKLVLVRGWVVALRRGRDKNGRPLLFLTFEDGTGVLESALFADAYQRFACEVQGRGPYAVRGKVGSKYGGISLQISWLGRDPG